MSRNRTEAAPERAGDVGGLAAEDDGPGRLRGCHEDHARGPRDGVLLGRAGPMGLEGGPVRVGLEHPVRVGLDLRRAGAGITGYCRDGLAGLGEEGL